MGYWSRVIGVIIGLCCMVLTGCEQKLEHKLVEAFIDNKQSINTFYGRGIVREYSGDILLATSYFEEWKGEKEEYRLDIESELTPAFLELIKDENLRLSMQSGTEIQVLKDSTLLSYDSNADTYYVREISAADALDNKGLGINEVMAYGGMKDYALDIINQLSDTHELEIEDNVKLSGRRTQHVIAYPKSEIKGIGIVDLWIDQETWLILKSVNKLGNYIIEQEYETFKINGAVDEERFDLEIPTDATVVELGEQLEIVDEEIALEEAIDRLNGNIFVLQENEDIQLEEIRYIETSNKYYATIKLSYRMKDGQEINIECIPDTMFQDVVDLDFEEVFVEGRVMEYIERGTVKMLEFIEEDILCTIYNENSEITKEELIEIAKMIELLP